MFSVEDLLISHGYKLPTNTQKSYEKNDRRHYELTQRRSGQGTLNGYETDSGVYSINRNPLVKDYCSDNEENQGSQKRQTSTASYNREPRGVDTVHTSEVGLHDSVPLARSSRPKTDKEIAYWRRRGQDFSALLGCNEKGDTETHESSPTTSKVISQSNSGCGTAKDFQEVGKGTRHGMSRNVLYESSKTSVVCQQQGLNIETWTNPTKSEKQMSAGVGDTFFEDRNTLILRNSALSSLYEGKSHSLPRFLSHENMRHVDLPMLSSGNQHSRDNDRIYLDMIKNSKTGSHFQNLPKPKYSRPLQPPSYQLHQQTKGTVELGGFQEDEQRDEHSPLVINISEPRHDSYTYDYGMEPPVYVPPPSYKSPPEQNVKDNSLHEVPKYDVCFNDAQRQHWVEIASVKQQFPTSNCGAEDKYCTDNHIAYGKDNHNIHMDHYASSVQYIPFDDPRIRHIKIDHDEVKQYDDKQMENAGCVGHHVLQGTDIKELHHNSAFLEPQNCLNSVPHGTMAVHSVNSNTFVRPSIKDKENHGLPDQRDSVTTSCEIADRKHSNIKNTLPWKEESCRGACENVTALKRFEAESEIQCKVSSGKKKNETIFCLVSIPVTTVSGSSDIDRNNNDLTQGKAKIDEVDESSTFFHGHGLLSSSSTDLELQALTGSMTNKNGLEKQEPSRQEEHKHTNDLRIFKHTKHRELRYSGSWPGDQCRDQQTQTLLSQEPPNSQYVLDKKLTRSNDASPDPNCIASVPVIGSKKTTDTYSQNVYSIKGKMYFNPSINSAFSRTMPSANLPKPKAHQKQLYRTTSASTNGKGPAPVTKSEAVKGEVTATCNSKEVFGQFLLKPASRRPCDAISELEIFNKELQERESGQTEESADKKQHQQDQVSMEMRDSNMQIKHESKPAMKVQQAQLGRVQSKSESWSEDNESENIEVFSGLKIPLPAQDCRGQSVRSVNRHALREIKIRDMEAENKKNTQCLSSVSPTTTHRLWTSNSMKAHKTELLPSASFKDTCKDQLCFDDVLRGYKKPIKTASPENDSLVGKCLYIRLSASNRKQGQSEPDLSTLNINGSPQPGRNTSEECHEKEDTLETPENESLQARAERILGIEVAVDSLTSSTEGARQGHQPNSAISSLDQGYPEALRVNGTMQTEGATDRNSSVGIEKYVLNESSASKGEMNNVSYGLPQTFTLQKCNNKTNDVSMSPETALAQLTLGELEQDHSVFCQASPFCSEDNKVATSGSERKGRSTSKMIETLQEKLASTPKRTALDRLVRMKEVHSVSRMRRLSIKRSDSGDEADDEKEPQKAEEDEGRKLTFGRNELSHTLTIQTSAVSKRIISLDEKAKAATKSRTKLEEDVFYLDAYDPTRVERV